MLIQASKMKVYLMSLDFPKCTAINIKSRGRHPPFKIVRSRISCAQLHSILNPGGTAYKHLFKSFLPQQGENYLFNRVHSKQLQSALQCSAMLTATPSAMLKKGTSFQNFTPEQ